MCPLILHSFLSFPFLFLSLSLTHIPFPFLSSFFPSSPLFLMLPSSSPFLLNLVLHTRWERPKLERDGAEFERRRRIWPLKKMEMKKWSFRPWVSRKVKSLDFLCNFTPPIDLRTIKLYGLLLVLYEFKFKVIFGRKFMGSLLFWFLHEMSMDFVGFEAWFSSSTLMFTGWGKEWFLVVILEEKLLRALLLLN
jgi:hypothetical protein